MRKKVESLSVPRIGDGFVTILPEARHEVWHASDGGDWELCYFDLPQGLDEMKLIWHIRNAWQETCRKWLDQQEKEGKKATTPPTPPFGPYPRLDLDGLGYDRYFIAARWKLTRPRVLDVDSASLIVGTEVPPELQFQYIEQMRAMAGIPLEDAERAARERVRLAAVAEREARLRTNLAWLSEHRDASPQQRKTLLLDV